MSYVNYVSIKLEKTVKCSRVRLVEGSTALSGTQTGRECGAEPALLGHSVPSGGMGWVYTPVRPVAGSGQPPGSSSKLDAKNQ